MPSTKTSPPKKSSRTPKSEQVQDATPKKATPPKAPAKKNNKKNQVINEPKGLEGFGLIGHTLKTAREAGKHDYPTITLETRIRAEHLKAMEEGNFNALPEGVYRRTHLKTYAEYLKLDAAPLLEELSKVTGEIEIKPVVSLEGEPYQPAFSPPMWLVGLALFIALALFGAWQMLEKPAPLPVEAHEQAVVKAYTQTSPEITILAVKDTVLAVMEQTNGAMQPVWRGDMREGDTWFVPEGAEVVIYPGDEKAINVFVGEHQAVSLDHLERIGSGIVLNRTKLLATVEVK